MSSRHLGRIARETGQELVDSQFKQVELFRRNKLTVEVPNPPELAVVEMDGGRIQTRQEGQGIGTHEPRWRETKNALFMRMQSQTHAEDPCPELPDSLQNRSRIRKLVLEFSGTADGVQEHSDDEEFECESHGYEGPKRLVRSCLSTLVCSQEFGPLMQAEAHRRGLYQSDRRAFVADGMKCNWKIHQRYFPGFIPIVDFLHVVSYLYHAAVAIAEDEDFGWGHCLDWTRMCWQGHVRDVISELSEWMQAQERSPNNEPLSEDDPRAIVQRAHTYLTNNQARMDYPQYRRLGLPITSSLMESLIKEINWRVKGSEKFWNDPHGANPILALRAATLCDDQRLDKLLLT